MVSGTVTPGWQSADYAYRSKAQASATDAVFCPETERVGEKEGRVIGLATLPYGTSGMNYGLVARYAPESTESDPVVQVTSNYGGERVEYQVHINEVNPRHATQLEMFALLSYTDDQNISDGGTFGSYHKMKVYADNAMQNGYWEGNADYDAFVNAQHDWQGLMISMWDEYSNAGIYSQMMNCISLNETMEKYSIRFVDFDSITFTDRSAETSLTYTGPGVQTTAASKTGSRAQETGAKTKEADAKTQETGSKAKEADAKAQETKESGEEEPTSYLQMIQEYMDELFTKIENGDTEPKFQLGDREYTIREWDELLEKFDSVQEAIRQLIREQIEERIERSKKMAAASEDVGADMITSNSFQARYPRNELDDDGNPKEVVFVSAIDRKGIRCSRPGKDDYEWEITFTDEEQYEKATAFMDWAGEHMDNFWFAVHENFWQDFLGGELDVEAFQEFLMGTNNGIPNYGITVGDSTYIDRDKVQWAKYMNHPDGRFYTAQEFAEMVAAEIEENQKNLTQLTEPYGETYRKYHPEYDGSAIFCEYPGGPLYTANEIGKRMLERAMLENDRSTSWSVRRALGLE